LRALACSQELIGEALDGQSVPTRHDEGAVDDVAQLTDIAGHSYCLKSLNEVGLDALDLLVLGPRFNFCRKKCANSGMSLEPLAERRALRKEEKL